MDGACTFDCRQDPEPCTIIWDFGASNVAMRVLANSTVQWSGNSESHPLAITADPPVSVDVSPNLQSARFTQPGSYPFKCTKHSSMNGTITVIPAP
jgi:plastocyanin